MKNSKTIEQLEKEFKLELAEYMHKIMLDKYDNAIWIAVNENFVITSFESQKEFDDSNSQLISRIYINEDSVRNTDPQNAKLFNILTDEEKKAVLARQQYYLSNDDFMFFDLDELLYVYAKEMFTKSFAKYVEFVTEFIIEQVMNSQPVKAAFEQLKNQMKVMQSNDEALNRVKQEKIDLETKLDKLNKFVASDKYEKLQEYSKALLIRQREIMKDYVGILNLRMMHWFDNEVSNNDK